MFDTQAEANVRKLERVLDILTFIGGSRMKKASRYYLDESIYYAEKCRASQQELVALHDIVRSGVECNINGVAYKDGKNVNSK